jgi:hypothetical protein
MPSSNSRTKVTERDVQIAKWAFSFAVIALAETFRESGQYDVSEEWVENTKKRLLDGPRFDSSIRKRLKETFDELGEPDGTPITCSIVGEILDVLATAEADREIDGMAETATGRVAACYAILARLYPRFSGRRIEEVTRENTLEWARMFAGRNE